MSNETKEAPPDKSVAKVKEEHLGVRTSGGALTRLEPKNFQELEHIAQILGKSDIVPKEMIGKPANILLALMFGNEIGLTPAQALQNIMVVNGRPTLWGDAVMGLVESSGQQEWWKDAYNPALDGGTWSFTTKRKGRDPVTRTFSEKDAVAAKLDKKEGPWQQYKPRMKFHRARSWALRDVYPDILKGIRVFEEERDVINLEAAPGRTYVMPGDPPAAAAVETTAAAAAAPAIKTDGEIISFQVSGAATTDFDGNPDCFVIRDRSEPPVKYFTDNEAYFKLAKAAKESGASLAGVFGEKTIEKTSYRWLLALQLKG